MAGQQQEEIETIRSRTIEVKLSDADVKRISEKAAAHGLTVGELIENFIGDLVCGTYSNGSDERMYAEQWFERCWFGMFPDLTFLRLQKIVEFSVFLLTLCLISVLLFSFAAFLSLFRDIEQAYQILNSQF